MMRSRPAWIHSKTPSQKHKQKLTKKKKKKNPKRSKTGPLGELARL
jgi:hypothetical protein